MGRLGVRRSQVKNGCSTWLQCAEGQLHFTSPKNTVFAAERPVRKKAAVYQTQLRAEDLHVTAGLRTVFLQSNDAAQCCHLRRWPNNHQPPRSTHDSVSQSGNFTRTEHPDTLRPPPHPALPDFRACTVSALLGSFFHSITSSRY